MTATQTTRRDQPAGGVKRRADLPNLRVPTVARAPRRIQVDDSDGEAKTAGGTGVPPRYDDGEYKIFSFY